MVDSVKGLACGDCDFFFQCQLTSGADMAPCSDFIVDGRLDNYDVTRLADVTFLGGDEV